MKRLLLATALSCFVASALYADTIVLKNGISMTGIIIGEDENQIEIEIYYGAGIITDKYSREKIEEVIKDLEENQKILSQYIEALERVKAKQHIRREAEEEQKRIMEELERKRQAEKNKKEKMEKRRKEVEIKKKERIKKEKEFKTFNIKVEELKASFEQKEIEDKAFRFAEITSYVRYEPPYGSTQFNPEYYKIYFQGLFCNEGNLTKKNVVVIMSFYDLEVKWLARRSVYTTPIDIPPGEKGSFEISIRKSFPFATYKVSAVWDY